MSHIFEKFVRRLALVLLALGVVGSVGIQTFAVNEPKSSVKADKPLEGDEDDYDYDYDDDTEYAEDTDFGEDDEDDADDQSSSNDDDDDDKHDNGDDDDDDGNKEKSASERKREALQKELDELKGERKKAQSERKEAQKQVKQLGNKRAEEQKRKRSIEAEIENLKKEVNLLETKRQILEKEIGKKKLDIEEKERNVQAEHECLAKRFRAMYVNGKSNEDAVLALVLGSGDFYAALTDDDYDKILLNKDKQLVDKIRKQKARIEDGKKALEAEKGELEETKKKLEANKKKLEANNIAVENVIYNLQLQEAAWERDSKKLKEEEEEYQREIDEILKQLKPKGGKYVGGEFSWPVPGYYTISSPYGLRNLDTGTGTLNDFHQGMDIAGSNIYGKNVVAANGGKVLFVCYSDGDRRYGSYGKYVIVDHGGGITTYYGHLSAISVSQDQEIARGEKIGEVGSTGYSTGPHLHFEVRENNKHVNPNKYLRGKNGDEESG
ncbi:MAG: peptidoglycan DD-metalloendopeptidase family protein [Oscillospiraceae bacterium]|nr:peptidoglycan DD-metalloendopeptidase family protein [Oscillospiraceae bacterium]